MEDVLHEAWLDAKSFVSSCVEQIRYCLNDTFLPGIYASAPTPLPPANYEDHTPPEENPKLGVLHHTIATSNVDTKTICAIVAHHTTSRNQTSPLKATLGRHNPATDSDAVILPPLGPAKGIHPSLQPRQCPRYSHRTPPRQSIDHFEQTNTASW